jgi:hypothetical protein
MIVFLDTEQKTITICDKTVKVYPFAMLNVIKKELLGKEVIYVSETVLTDGDSVVDLISQYVEEDNGFTDDGDGELYLRTTTKQKHSVGYNGKKIFFGGMYDMKPISLLPKGFVENCRTITEGIRDGIFEIVTEKQKFYIDQDKVNEENEKEQKLLQEDKSERFGSVDNPIEIDLNKTISFKKTKK